jgi:hypothetical protein
MIFFLSSVNRLITMSSMHIFHLLVYNFFSTFITIQIQFMKFLVQKTRRRVGKTYELFSKHYTSYSKNFMTNV